MITTTCRILSIPVGDFRGAPRVREATRGGGARGNRRYARDAPDRGGAIASVASRVATARPPITARDSPRLPRRGQARTADARASGSEVGRDPLTRRGT